jgi:hypothetical protein
MNKKSTVTCLILIGAELFAGVTMLAGYQAWIQPGAPRNHTQTKTEAAAPVPAAPVPAAPVPAPVQASAVEPPAVVQTAPAPAPPPSASPKTAAPKRPVAASAAQLPQARPAQPPPSRPIAPVTIPSPTPRQLTPAPAPEQHATLTQRGMVALNARDFSGAASLLRQARQAQPANPDIGYLLGMALEGSGEFGAAIDAFRSCKSGPYEQIARSHVKGLLKKLGK